MRGKRWWALMCLAMVLSLLAGGAGTGWAVTPLPLAGTSPDYFGTPNWANSPPLRKFVDTLPLLCSGTSGTVNNLGQCLPIAQADQATYPGSDYYEIEVGEYSEQMHSDMPPTRLRGYRQINTADPYASQFHYLGPTIVATKDRPVRVKFVNSIPANSMLFIPVDTTIMGSGMFEIDYDPETKQPMMMASGMFSQNRATLHLHGGRTPWISDGTPHQWITPAGETTVYPKGVSVEYVPDMWFDASGNTITSCAGQTTCGVAGASNNPGPGAQTFYWTNQQSGRLMFYHDHAWGITRLNVYAGEAAGFLLRDNVEMALEASNTIPGLADTIPLVIQDKTFVDETTIGMTDPTWNWGTSPGSAVTGDLWWPHVYMPAENPYNPDMTGINMFGRWMYSPWFWPPTPICGTDPDAIKPFCIEFGPVANPLYDVNCDPATAPMGICQPPFKPGTPDVSWGAEAFLDTMVVNGTAYPSMTVDPKAYRLRILNAAHDRFLNLQLYKATGAFQIALTNGGSGYVSAPTVTINGGGGTGATAVAMVSAGGGVTGATLVSGGSGYTTAAVSITGDGTGATGTATIDAGIVSSFTLLSPGTGYVTAPTVSISGGGGTGASATTTVVNGVVTSIAVTAGGTGYDGTTVITINGTGTGASAVAVVDGGTGAITAINVTDGGSGYDGTTTVGITGTGTGATATATVDPGIVTGITLVSGGSGYATAPTVELVGSGTGATASASVTNGVITAVNITNSGGGYTTASVLINGDGAGATATAAVTPGVGYVTGIRLTNSGTGYTSAPTVDLIGGGGSGATAAATFNLTEVAMVPAAPRPDCSATVLTNCVCTATDAPAGCFPASWPVDGREGGVPDPAFAGPNMIQIGTEGGFLPQPVELPNQPVAWQLDPTMFAAGIVLPQAQGGGTLMLAPAERADVIVDFSAFAGQTLILYNDAPAPWPALDPHYDYYTGAPDRTDMGGYTAVQAGYGPNIRTVMQINVAAGTPAPFNVAALNAAFASASPTTPGAFENSQEPIIVGQKAYNTTYNTTFPGTWPNWGISRISDTSLSFMRPDGTLVSNFPMKAKAIQDEMGEVFDDYGRMSAKLGLEVPFTNAGNQNFNLQNYVDPPTEIIKPGEVQIWKITHNGVDTHPIHFHLFEVQLINRVAWDGFIDLPDANELGWKDTIRISPLQDTIVALRLKLPTVPFALPNSVRPLNPEAPLGSMMGFSQIDPWTGADANPPITNTMHNFGYEYVWHCHILSHEENDMMRPIVVNPNALTAANIYWRNTANGNNLIWTLDGTTRTSYAYLPPVADQNWKLVGTGDFNSDGKQDLLWRNSLNGNNVVWYMDGATRLSYVFLPAVPDTNWQIVGTGDFNSDSKVDIIWRNSSTGDNIVWYMNGATRTSYAYFLKIADVQWTITGTGDFNGDNKTDILWRNTSTGANLVWFMDGMTRTRYTMLPALADLNWQMVGSGDYNNDVNTDILWRNSATGETLVWYMSGTGTIGTGTISPAITDLNWTIAGF